MLNGSPYITPTDAENVGQRIRETAGHFYNQPGNPLIAGFLSDLQEKAVNEFGFTWDEVEGIEAEAYREKEQAMTCGKCPHSCKTTGWPEQLADGCYCAVKREHVYRNCKECDAVEDFMVQDLIRYETERSRS